jgi:hypothetical protein
MSTLGTVDITGDDAQNVIGCVVHGDVVRHQVTYVRGRPSMCLGTREIADRLAGHVPARNHDLIVKALDTNRAIVLTGPPGCGRETTAIAAFRALSYGIPIRRFSPDVEDLQEKGACGYLVNAGDADPARLGGCADAVRAAGGYLVVIAEESVPGLDACIEVDPPPPVQVYRRWLAVRGLGGTGWPLWDEAPALLERALPADAARLAELVASSERAGGDPVARRADVARAYGRWAEQLRGWFAAHPRPSDRALLVAAATLAPVEETAVYPAARLLARRLQVTMDGAGLAWCPVTRLRELVGADRDGERIVFRRRDFARSTLAHVCEEYPLARLDLVGWLAALPADKDVPSRMRNPLAETFADLAAAHGTADQVTEAARTWAEEGLADLAFIALSRTCLDRRIGGRVRESLYDWSRRARTGQTLKLTVARVCEPLGLTYPSIALTRLKHLATHGNRQVVDEVITAALALADSGHRRAVLDAALTWSAGEGAVTLSVAARQRRMRAGALLFLRLAAVPDGGDAVRPLACVPAWRVALADPAVRGAEFEAAMETWLDAAVRHPRLRRPITDTFVAAALPLAVRYGLPTPFGAVSGPAPAKIMMWLVRRWAAAAPRDRIRRDIKDDIVIPLTRPWWLRLLKGLYALLRTSFAAAR